MRPPKTRSEGPGEPREPGNIQRLDAIDLEGIEILRVIGKRHAGALGRSQPLVLFAEGDNVIQKLIGEIGLEKPSLGRGGDGPLRNGGLVEDCRGRAVRRHVRRDEVTGIVDVRQRLRQRCRVARSGGRALKLRARIERESSRGRVAADAGVTVESVLKGTAVVVHNGLPEMIAVVERRAADGARQAVH